MSKGQRALMWLGQAVTTADNASLGRVVALLDGMRSRGEADVLLDRARDRLRQLRPQRPLGFTRLLFLPLDGAIVPPSRWRRGEGRLPRSALPVLSELVHAALGPEAESIAAACEGKTVEDDGAVGRVGPRLWTAAARGLPASAPPEWEESGLAAADYPEIAALCRPVWAAGPALRTAAGAAPGAPVPGDRALAALAALAEAGPAPFSAGLATLAGAAPLPGAVLRAAAALDPRLRPLAVKQAEAALDRAAPEFDRLDPCAAAAAAAALAARLDDVEGCGLLDPAGRKRLHAQRRAAEEACRERFLAGAESEVIAPLSALGGEPGAADAAVAGIEAAARGLARLESAGRRLGGGAYDRARGAVVESLNLLAAPARRPGGLRPVDLARVVEILAGPEEAAALLARCRAAEPQPSAGTPAGSPLPAR